MYSPHIKNLAYKLDPTCWVSYSGKSPRFKRAMEVRRVCSLSVAERILKEKAMSPTLDDVKNAARDFVRCHGLSRAKQVLEDESGAHRVVDLRPDQYRHMIDCFKTRTPDEEKMPPLKIKMMLHFATTVGPFAPEEVRRSPAYTTFVVELLRDGMIERPTKKQRAAHPGWAYKATPRGQCYVEALTALPLPVRATPEWVIPPR